MKKYALFTLAAVASLLAISCAKENITDTAIEKAVVDPWTPVPLTEVTALPGSHTLNAGFDNNTKSALNGSSVEWSAGDTFTMMGYSGGSYQVANYTTTAGGALASFTGGSTISYTENGLHCLYPAASFNTPTNLGGLLHIPARIPTVQAATPGSVAPGANLSYAQAATQSDDLHFKNMLALVKFKLSGDVVSQVKSVTFRGVSNLAGIFYLSLSSATPAFETGWTSSAASRSVKLTGDFVAGQDYYIAVAPGVQDGFTMLFENSDGSKFIKKVSSKVLTLSRSRIVDFGTINLGADFPAVDPTPTPYMTASAGAPKSVTMVVIPDGFTEAQLDDFETKARSGIDALFNTEPFKTYKNYFQVWILKQASNESGANITDGSGNITTARDCYFGTRWGATSYSDMKSNEDKVFAFVEDNCPDITNGTHSINEVAVLLLVNDERYGGISWNWASGKTYCIVPVGNDGTITWTYANVGYEAASATAIPWDKREVLDSERDELGRNNNGTWRNTLVHEFGGHSFGKLGDEYWYNETYTEVTAVAKHSWTPVPFSLNISATNIAASTPWAELFESANVTAMNSKDATKYGRIGIFQGGDVSMFYRWRSEKISCMIDNRFYFSTWQRRLIVNRLMGLAGLTAPTFADFLAKDVPDDKLRDGGGSPVVLPDGLVNNIPPKPMPMLPPPVLVD